MQQFFLCKTEIKISFLKTVFVFFGGHPVSIGVCQWDNSEQTLEEQAGHEKACLLYTL